jgi:uncharacterized protein YceK
MKLDTRLYFLKDPFLYIPLFLFLGGLGMIIKNEQPKAKATTKESVTAVKKDTTEWRKQYYEHLYHSTPNTTVQHISGKVSK